MCEFCLKHGEGPNGTVKGPASRGVIDFWITYSKRLCSLT